MITASHRERAKALDASMSDLDRLLCACERLVERGREDLSVAGDKYTAENWQTARSHLLTAIAHLQIARKFLA